MNQDNQSSGLTIKLTKSPIGRATDQKATVVALGLRRVGATVVRPDNPSVRGMVFKIRHLVTVTAAAAVAGVAAESEART